MRKFIHNGLALWALASCAGWAGEVHADPPGYVRMAAVTRGQNPPLPANSEAAPADRLKPIDDVRLPQANAGPMPQDLAAERFGMIPPEFQPTGLSRPWTWTVRTWESPAFCYRPLYFNDDSLERYGYAHGWKQPAVSTAKASGRLLALPALMVAMPPHDCVYPPQRSRPGTCPQ